MYVLLGLKKSKSGHDNQYIQDKFKSLWQAIKFLKKLTLIRFWIPPFMKTYDWWDITYDR